MVMVVRRVWVVVRRVGMGMVRRVRVVVGRMGVMVVVRGVAEVGRRRCEDVGEVREEEQGREADEEELRAVHSAGAGVDGFGLRLLARCLRVSGLRPFPRRGVV